MTAVFMLGALVLFLIDRKWSRILLLILVPVCGFMAYFLTKDTLTVAAALAGTAAAAFSPLLDAAAGAGSKTTGAIDTEEDDILDNKTKWRLIVAGYVIFILFAVFSVVSIIRLNAKINTLYGFTKDLEERIEESNSGQK